MTRLAPYTSRPEDAADADEYYDQSEANRYHVNPEVARKQLELTCRALDILALGPAAACAALGSHCLIADIGCGSGLSGSVLSHLGWPWIGLDISQHMLQVRVANCISSSKQLNASSHLLHCHDLVLQLLQSTASRSNKRLLNMGVI